MVILTDTIFRKHLDPFFRWKLQKGFDLKVLYRGTDLAGNTYTQLKDTLAKIYNASSVTDPAPEYLLIIGDVNRIPTYTTGGGTGNITDMYYGEFDGDNDYIPEMYIGRLPVADTSELKSVVKKIIDYEKFEFADTNRFYNRAMVTAGNDTNFVKYMNGQVQYAVENYLNKSNNIDEYHFSFPKSSNTGTIDSIKKIINNGVSFINYSGHGSADGWLFTTSGTSFYLKSTDIAKLTNKNMYPFVISNACRTGQFNTASSLGNRLVISDEKGALGFIGCSNDSYWDEDYYWSIGPCTPTISPTYSGTGLGAYDRLFHTHGESPSEWYNTMGQVNYAGNLAVSASTSSRKRYYWETYNLVGDPTIMPYIGKPDTFRVILPDTLPNGIKSYSINIDPFAYMAVSHFDTLWDASFASPSGAVTFNLPGVSNDSCLFVISGQNKKPFIKTVRFSTVKEEFVNLSSVEINDSGGNNNGRVDFGEFFYLKLALRNLGLTDAQNLYAKISSPSAMINIENDSVWLGNMAAGSETVLSENFGMTVSGNIMDLGAVTINLVLKDAKTEKHYNLDLIVHAPQLKIISCKIDDTEFGNGNQLADPGETFKLILRVSNQGSSSISGQMNVSIPENYITVLEPSVKSGLLKFGEETDIPVLVKLSETSSPGNYFTIISTLDCSPYVSAKDFSFRVGRVRESFESGSFNIFPWINTSAIPWVLASSDSYDGTFSARSGIISHDGTTSLIIRTVYSNEDSVKFYYKVSSEAGYDFFAFKINDKEIIKKSGETAWVRAAHAVPAGLNKMEWIYAKDNSVSKGSDCAWIDMIDFMQLGTVSYIQKDLNVAKIINPVQTDKYGQENVTVKILNLGNNIMNGFNLAYAINDHLPVKEFFENKAYPFGDTVTVTFKTRADLSKFGIYNISVYGIDNADQYLLNDTARVNIKNTDAGDSFCIVYPNPFVNEFRVFFNSPVAGEVDITIFNQTGKKIYTIRKSVLSGKNEITISGLTMAPSIYYLNIRGASLNKSVPILKITR
jgi:hypothetical protein